MAEMKTCKRCSEPKDATAGYYANGHEHRHTICKECQRKENTARYHANKDRYLPKQRVYAANRRAALKAGITKGTDA